MLNPICFYELVSLGSFVSKRLNLYFEELDIFYYLYDRFFVSNQNFTTYM